MTETAAHPDTHERQQPSVMIQVWDPIIRISHWVLVAGFLTAYLTEGEPEWLHTSAGYAVAITVLGRVAWGFIGPERARFSDFVRGPGAAIAYIKGVLSGTAPRFIGHNPAGGLMIVAMLASLAATTYTGMAMLAEDGRGPLAAVETSPAVVSTALADEYEHDRDAHGAGGHSEAAETWEEWHETFANLTLALMLLHVLGVVVSSTVHRENLVRAMIDGRKRA